MTELLAISTINIIIARDSGRTVESIQLSTESEGPLRDIQTTLRAGDVHQEKFDPLFVVKSDDHVCISAGSNPRSRKRFEVVVTIDLQSIEWVHESQGIKSYRKKTTYIEVEIVCRPQDKLVPTTDELIHMCTKFRILVIGNSGVGKSTLIRRMFDVRDVYASETIRGDADIDKEFISGRNQRFVVHDSLGFEAGDERNLEVIKDFVKRKQAMPRLEDQLHAIWLCMEVPHSGGRLVERGVEQLLKNQRDILGNVPLIVVLTKVDLLDIRLEFEARDNEPVESRRKSHLDKHCIGPLQKAAGRDVPCVAVSAKEGYYILISKLMDATQENMASHSVNEALRAMAAIAQRVDIKEKIEMSINVGKKKYWNNLLKSAFFRGRTFKECLEVIRTDIVTVWDFIDLDYGSLDEKLIEALIPTNISQPTIRTWLPQADEQFLSDMAKNIAGTVSAILNLRYESYKDSEAVLDVEILMSYIVDLICVMQVIFLLAPDGLVTRDIVARAIELTKDKREQVHDSIKGFDKKRAVHAGGEQDLVLREIEKLISQYKLSELEIAKLRREAASSTINV